MMYRVLAGVGIGIVGVFTPWWLVVPLAIMYAFYFSRAYELVVLAACIDAFFGDAVPIPYYTVGAMLVVAIAEIIKPHLSFYAYIQP